MPRVKRGTTIRKRHKKLLALTKGFKHGRKNLVRLAHQAMLRAGQYAYRDRRVKKRDFRSRWIIKINAAVSAHEMSYSLFIAGLKKAKLELNRKVLAELAEFHPEEFDKVVAKVKLATQELKTDEGHQADDQAVSNVEMKAAEPEIVDNLTPTPAIKEI